MHSIETALVKVQSNIVLNMDQQKVTLVLIDLSVTFDTMDLELLLNIMKCSIGVSGTARN